MHKVLLVEDEDIIRKGLRYIVDWQSVDCVVVGEAENGAEGLRLIRALSPDIVLTDVKMPGMDGLDMLSASIREVGYDAVIISGYGEFAYAQKAISLGVTEYLLKPIDFDLLYAAVQKVRRKRESETQIEKLRTAQPVPEVLSQAEGAKNKAVRYMLDFIGQRYGQRISLVDVSAELSLSCAHLNAKFKAETGHTFNDYLNRFRILRAVELLREGGMKVYEVAEAVGFMDYKYFIKVFKKYVGYPPGRFSGAEPGGEGKQGTALRDLKH
ncbi:MAG: response regulator [Candidatus Limiplasma sp.]|nr:response regulator [Candidatus Limiplasma sp.]